MQLNLINRTTSRPTDKLLDRNLQRICKIRERLHYIPDIWLVNDLEMAKYIRHIKSFDPDAVGLYFSHHPSEHKPLVIVSPELIWDAAIVVHGMLGDVLSLPKIYRTLFCAVVAHELAHALMDETSRYQEVIEEAGYCRECIVSSSYFPGVRRWAHIVEESLANAVAVEQGFTSAERSIVEEFIKLQSIPYRSGLNWKLNPEKLYSTVKSWASFKIEIQRHRWERAYSPCGSAPPLQVIADSITKHFQTEAVDFELDFVEYITNNHPVWQKEYIKNSHDAKLDGFLNGPFGVYWTLCLEPFATIKEPFNRRILLRTWTRNFHIKTMGAIKPHSASHGYDKAWLLRLKNAAMFCRKRGVLQKAINFEQKRLKILRSWQTTNSHVTREIEEVDALIQEMHRQLTTT